METVRHAVTIPEDHRLKIEVKVPDSVPAGDADLLLVFAPRTKAKDGRLAELAGCLRGSPVFAGDPVHVQRDLRNEWD